MFTVWVSGRYWRCEGEVVYLYWWGTGVWQQHMWLLRRFTATVTSSYHYSTLCNLQDEDIKDQKGSFNLSSSLASMALAVRSLSKDQTAPVKINKILICWFWIFLKCFLPFFGIFLLSKIKTRLFAIQFIVVNIGSDSCYLRIKFQSALLRLSPGSVRQAGSDHLLTRIIN